MCRKLYTPAPPENIYQIVKSRFSKIFKFIPNKDNLNFYFDQLLKPSVFLSEEWR